MAVISHTLHTPSARGSATLVRAKLRNILTGEFLEKTFKSGEAFREPDLVYRQAQFLYSDNDDLHFMDEETFDQFSLPAEKMPELTPWLTEGLSLRAVHFEGQIASVELPKTLEVEVLEADPAVRGNTASGKVLKRAVVAAGAEIQVPLFVEVGEKIEVDPHEARFLRRS